MWMYGVFIHILSFMSRQTSPHQDQEKTRSYPIHCKSALTLLSMLITRSSHHSSFLWSIMYLFFSGPGGGVSSLPATERGLRLLETYLKLAQQLQISFRPKTMFPQIILLHYYRSDTIFSPLACSLLMYLHAVLLILSAFLVWQKKLMSLVYKQLQNLDHHSIDKIVNVWDSDIVIDPGHKVWADALCLYKILSIVLGCMKISIEYYTDYNLHPSFLTKLTKLYLIFA